MIGDFNPVHSTNDIWRDEEQEQCLTLDLEAIEANITSLQTNKADTNHTHAINDITNLSSVLNSKYEKPSTGIPKTDLASDVQTSLGKADSALQSYTETDPTVPAWAKATTKPTYTASEVGALPTNTTLADLTDDATHRTVTDTEKAAWNAKSTFSGSYNDLTDKPTIPSTGDFATTSYVDTKVATKVDQVEGKGLSTNDYTTAEKTKLAGIEAGANNTVVDSAFSVLSDNPVKNSVISAALAGKANLVHTHSDKADADHTHDDRYYTESEIDTMLNNKVNIVSGKDLSTNDFSTDYKNKLDGIEAGANKTNVFSSLVDAGVTSFPTTMQYIAMNIPANSMIIIDTRRINGVSSTYSTETISDWGNTTNGVAIIMKGLSSARVTMMILYGSSAATFNNIIYGNYAIDNNQVNWTSINEKFNSKVDKVKTYSAVDLNTLTESGLYYVSSETAELNCPVGSNGHILVMSDGTRVRQVFFRVGTVNTNNFQWYSRSLGSDTTVGDNGWSKWWLMSGCELVYDGTSVLNQEISLGSRYGCQAWVFAAQLSSTGTLTTIYVPRYFLTTNTTKYRLQIADESAFINFYFYYKSSNDTVYAKVVDYTNDNYAAIKYVYRVS